MSNQNPVMHDSLLRLLNFAREATAGAPVKVRDVGDLAGVMGESPQTIHNWGKRGVSLPGAAKAERLFGCSVKFIQTGEAAPIPPDTVKDFTNFKPIDTNSQPGIICHQAGVIYSWDEVLRMYKSGLEGSLPDVFSVEMADDSLAGRARRGDVITLCRSRVETVEAGDGIMVKTAKGSYMIRIYKPKGDDSFLAVPMNPNYLPLHSDRDGLTILAVVVGVPQCRWSAL